jgi:hypothetical protein
MMEKAFPSSRRPTRLVSVAKLFNAPSKSQTITKRFLIAAGVIYTTAKMPIRREKHAADILSGINLAARRFTTILYNGAATCRYD